MTCFTHPPVKPKDEDIFIDDVNLLVQMSYPDYEGQHPLFKKFGTRTGGINDTWLYTKDWEQLDEVDKWKYVALCALYWQKQYAYWCDKKDYQHYKELLKEWGKNNPAFLETLKQLEEEEEQQWKSQYLSNN